MGWPHWHISSALAFRSSQGVEEGNVCVYTDPYICMHVHMHIYMFHIYLCIMVYIYINLNLNFYYFPNSNPLQHGTFWSLSLLTDTLLVKNCLLPPISCKIMLQKRRRDKNFLRKTKIWEIHHWQICPVNNVPSSGKRKYDTGKKPIYIKKSVAEGINRGRIESLIFLIFNLSKIHLCKVMVVIIIW